MWNDWGNKGAKNGSKVWLFNTFHSFMQFPWSASVLGHSRREKQSNASNCWPCFRLIETACLQTQYGFLFCFKELMVWPESGKRLLRQSRMQWAAWCLHARPIAGLFLCSSSPFSAFLRFGSVVNFKPSRFHSAPKPLQAQTGESGCMKLWHRSVAMTVVS